MITDADAQALAVEINEAIPALRKFFAIPREDKIIVLKAILDGQIGSEETASLRSVAGLTPSMLEMISDPALDMMAKAMVKWIGGGE